MAKLVFNAEMLAKSVGCKNGNEIVFEEYFEIRKSDGSEPQDPKFEYFKKKVLDHLAELEKKENGSISKSIDIMEWIQKANFPVGTTRTWNGQKFRKITPKKWVRIYESESMGAKLAVAALRRKAAACKNSEELLQLCLENKERFVDANGRPLAFMQEFSEYVSGLNDRNIGNGKNKKGALRVLTKQETHDFIEKHKTSKINERVSLGEISNVARNRIKNATGLDVFRVILDSDSIRHAYEKKEHNLEPNDLDDMKDVIDTTTDISLSSDKKPQGNPIIIFKKQEANGVILCEEYRAGKKELELQTAYRIKKNRQPHGAGNNQLPANVLDATAPNPNIQQTGEKSSGKKGIESISTKYHSSKSIDGDEDEIYVGKETISGKWKLVEADAPSASHDEITFRKTEGFPATKTGGTVNDRDYEHDTAAQEAVLDMSADFDGRALGFDSPIVVTQDGVVTSGNNRTMSSKLAARKGTDTKYIEALKKRAKKFGFSADDVAQFKHPRVVFETEHTGDYTTDEFAKYNESGKKAKSPIEKAIEVSKRMKPEVVENIASNISDFDTMGELYADRKASQNIFDTLIQTGIIQKTDLPQYFADNNITENGKEFLETVLIGSVINETNIRALNGAKSLRQKLVRAIVPLVENKGMNGYSINKELNKAVNIAVQVATEKSKRNPAFRSVEEFSHLQDMFEPQDPVAIELAKKLDGRTQKEFAEFMLEMNGGLRPAANGEVDIFLGNTENKEDIVNRILNIKKTVEKALNRFFEHFGKIA